MGLSKKDTVCDLSVLETRANGIADWLKSSDGDGGKCLEEQKHLDAGTQERVYWQYGYMIALRDVLKLLTGERRVMVSNFPSDRRA